MKLKLKDCRVNMNVGNCTLVLTLLSRLDEIYFDQYGSIMARFADIQSISEVIDTPAVIFSINIYLSGVPARNCCQIGKNWCSAGSYGEPCREY